MVDRRSVYSAYSVTHVPGLVCYPCPWFVPHWCRTQRVRRGYLPARGYRIRSEVPSTLFRREIERSGTIYKPTRRRFALWVGHQIYLPFHLGDLLLILHNDERLRSHLHR